MGAGTPPPGSGWGRLHCPSRLDIFDSRAYVLDRLNEEYDPPAAVSDLPGRYSAS
ncbi:hypothetical protein O7632_30405 [Solwaraspora sp. WMMD406]|uniref:hypothetical protein n=1 Tax=Solwaraspora sp. WMMD406 TaxID=3016095 RepID=UPI00241763A9|nr:hypothetical protein [Solwaraspora sp. WMMD406]MDG4768372.1 hypothetical protein [Solwaraspora sp. WMMD406]